ncbi:unnamed protein product, partial [Musa textilis]
LGLSLQELSSSPFLLGTPTPRRLCSSPIGIELIAEKGWAIMPIWGTCSCWLRGNRVWPKGQYFMFAIK